MVCWLNPHGLLPLEDLLAARELGGSAPRLVHLFGQADSRLVSPLAIDLTGDGITEYLYLKEIPAQPYPDYEWVTMLSNPGIAGQEVPSGLPAFYPPLMRAVDWNGDGRQDLLLLSCTEN